MSEYSITMATFSTAITSGTAGTARFTPFNGVTQISFSTARIETISIQDDDPNFGDARNKSFSDLTGQTLTSPVTFGNDPAPTGTTTQLTDWIHSEIQMLDAAGQPTGQIFKTIFPVNGSGAILGGSRSVLIFPVAQTNADGVTITPRFDPTATYAFKRYVPYSSSGSDFIPYPAPTCFADGTLIDTQSGRQPIETLRTGQYVRTRDNGLRRLYWIGARNLTAADLDLNPSFRPIRIRAGALGGGLPTSDLTVSPQHRVLIQNGVARKLFGTDQLLVAAKHLTELPGIDVVRDAQSVRYWHMLFDGHELVRSNGAWTESLYTGEQALRSVSPAARREILMLFPELADPLPGTAPPAARPFLTGKQGRKMARHLLRKGAALIDA